LTRAILTLSHSTDFGLLSNCSAMPVRFDDFSKVATAVLSDDFHVSGHTIKTKQKTNWDGSVVSTQVDLFDKTATSAKISVKMPAPMGCSHASVDKLEVDKTGKFKLEASSKTQVPGLKVEGKSDLVNLSKVVAGCTYTGLQDTHLKFECKALDPREFAAEATYARGHLTYGVKATQAVFRGSVPDVGVRFQQAPYFCSLVAKDSLSSLNAACGYTVNSDVKLAATYQLKSGAGSFVLGMLYRDLYRIKVAQDQTVHVCAKHTVAKGFSLLGGAKYSLKNNDFTYGVQLAIE